MYWIDYDGKMRGYDTIEAGGRKTQNTYSTHSWTAVALDEGKRRQRCVLNDALVHVVRRTEDRAMRATMTWTRGGIDEGR